MGLSYIRPAEGTSSRAAFTRRRNKKSLGRLSLAWPNRNGQSEGWWETNYYSHPSSRLVSRTSNKQPHAHHQTRGQQHEKQKQSTNDKPVFTRRHKERVWEGRSWPTRGNNQRYQARIHVHVPCVSLRPVIVKLYSHTHTLTHTHTHTHTHIRRWTAPSAQGRLALCHLYSVLLRLSLSHRIRTKWLRPRAVGSC